jgi:hypothetical protein
MKNPFSHQVVRDHKVPKEFSYAKGKCTLNFILRIDIKSELRDFLELLKVAQKEVEEELKK